jgi:hypothetical protein
MSGQRYRLALAMALVLSLVYVPAVLAQTATGAITGRALDDGELVLPGTTVTITSPAMIGGERTTVTDEQGAYRFTLLVSGTYRVSFMLPGFTTLNIDEVDVGAGATMTINGTLKLGTLSEEVTVTNVAPTMEQTEHGSAPLGQEPAQPGRHDPGSLLDSVRRRRQHDGRDGGAAVAHLREVGRQRGDVRRRRLRSVFW